MAKHHPLDLKEGKSPKAKINRENLRQALVLFKYLKPYRGKFILGMVFIALTAFSTSLFPLSLGKMIDAASPGAALPGIAAGSKFGLRVEKYSLEFEHSIAYYLLSAHGANFFFIYESVSADRSG